MKSDGREDGPAATVDLSTAAAGGDPKGPLAPEEIKARRKAAGLTQLELGNELGVSLRTVARWETGEGTPSDLQMRRLHELAAQKSLRSVVPGTIAGAALATSALGIGLGPLGLLAAGVGFEVARNWFGNKTAPTSDQQSLPAGLRDALLLCADHLDTSPRKLREAVLALVYSAAESGCSAAELCTSLAQDGEVSEVVRETLLAIADGLDVSPRKLRGAVCDIIRASEASGLTEQQLLTILTGVTATVS